VEDGVVVRRGSGVVLYGVVLAVVLTLVAGAAGYVYLQRTGVFTRTDRLDNAVVVFASHAEDGAEVAQVVAHVTDDGRSVRLVDPRKAVTIAGTSYDRLGDAYPFGGGEAVAAALTGLSGAGVAYVDVGEKEWIALLARGGDVSVVVPKALEVFDGSRLVSFAEGTQTVPAVDVPALLRGVAYLGAEDRMRVVDAVGEASLTALASGGVPAGVRTNLTAGAYERLLAALLARR
jgi:hypothetical protein